MVLVPELNKTGHARHPFGKNGMSSRRSKRTRGESPERLLSPDDLSRAVRKRARGYVVRLILGPRGTKSGPRTCRRLENITADNITFRTSKMYVQVSPEAAACFSPIQLEGLRLAFASVESAAEIERTEGELAAASGMVRTQDLLVLLRDGQDDRRAAAVSSGALDDDGSEFVTFDGFLRTLATLPTASDAAAAPPLNTLARSADMASDLASSFVSAVHRAISRGGSVLSSNVSGKPFTCGICLDTLVDFREKHRLIGPPSGSGACNRHDFCKGCVRQWLSVVVPEGSLHLACPLAHTPATPGGVNTNVGAEPPFSSCGGCVGEADLVAVGVAPRVLAAWRRFSLKRSPTGHRLVDCPHCDELVDPVPAAAPDLDTTGRSAVGFWLRGGWRANCRRCNCPSCGRPFCREHLGAHEGRSCLTFVWKQRLRAEGAADDESLVHADSKPCPRCAVPTYKSSGCNHMRCSICVVAPPPESPGAPPDYCHWCWCCGECVDGAEEGIGRHFTAGKCAGMQFGAPPPPARAGAMGPSFWFRELSAPGRPGQGRYPLPPLFRRGACAGVAALDLAFCGAFLVAAPVAVAAPFLAGGTLCLTTFACVEAPLAAAVSLLFEPRAPPPPPRVQREGVLVGPPPAPGAQAAVHHAAIAYLTVHQRLHRATLEMLHAVAEGGAGVLPPPPGRRVTLLRKARRRLATYFLSWAGRARYLNVLKQFVVRGPYPAGDFVALAPPPPLSLPVDTRYAAQLEVAADHLGLWTDLEDWRRRLGGRLGIWEFAGAAHVKVNTTHAARGTAPLHLR